MATLLKCPFDNKTFKNKKDLEDYVKANYIDKIPKKYGNDVAHFLYDFRNGPRRCQICGQRTKWNEAGSRYEVLCDVYPESVGGKVSLFDKIKIYYRKIRSIFKNKGNTCSQVMRKNYLNNINNKYKTDNLMKDPEYQKMLLENRKIADVVKYNDLEYTVIGSYEKKFVEIMEKLRLNNDLDVIYKQDLEILMPGPTVYYGKDKYWIPDAYIPILKLYISIKDDGHNPKYRKNYEKSCEVFTHLFLKDDDEYKGRGPSLHIGIIELNSSELTYDKMKVIFKYVNSYVPDPDFMHSYFNTIIPVYMKKYRPDLYAKCVKRWKQKVLVSSYDNSNPMGKDAGDNLHHFDKDNSILLGGDKK